MAVQLRISICWLTLKILADKQKFFSQRFIYLFYQTLSWDICCSRCDFFHPTNQCSITPWTIRLIYFQISTSFVAINAYVLHMNDLINLWCLWDAWRDLLIILSSCIVHIVRRVTFLINLRAICGWWDERTGRNYFFFRLPTFTIIAVILFVSLVSFQ